MLAVLLLIAMVSFTQIKCKDYHLKKCEAYSDKMFKYSGQSRSAYFEAGQTSNFKLVCYKGMEYRVSICNDKNLKGLFFRIREDNADRNILYDSSTDEKEYLEKLFYVEKSKNLVIEVVVPESEVAKEEVAYENLFGCVGVLIEYSRRNDTGFED